MASSILLIVILLYHNDEIFHHLLESRFTYSATSCSHLSMEHAVAGRRHAPLCRPYLDRVDRGLSLFFFYHVSFCLTFFFSLYGCVLISHGRGRRSGLARWCWHPSVRWSVASGAPSPRGDCSFNEEINISDVK